MKLLLLVIFSLSCTSLKKDNETKKPLETKDEIMLQLDVYRESIKAQLDDNELVVMDGSIGDSALFSCLARAAGAANFDPGVFFVDGKPFRHPDIDPSISKTPMSKDMLNGLLWCLYSLHMGGYDDKATVILEDFIAYGKANKITVGVDIGWKLCSNEDKKLYKISEADWAGKCIAPAATIKDVYRIAKLIGMPCDADCAYYSAIGVNIPSDKKGFERHLAVLTTLRNGLADGAINDNSLSIVLDTAHKAEPKNALYQAAYHTFVEGDQSDAYALLADEVFFPKDSLPTKNQYCTEYLYQRDETNDDGSVNSDWEPCPEDDKIDRGRGIDFAFAAALALGELSLK